MAKITTGELYNEWQSINDKLDKLNEKVDSVIDDGAIETRLTGSIEEDEVFSRAIINNESVTRYIRPRPGVREVAIYARIYSSTGVFESGQGLSIAVTPRYDAARTFGIINTGKTNGNNRGIAIYIGKGYSDWKDDNVSSVLPRQYHINSGIAPLYGFQLKADGSFESGEGIDCDLQVQWIY